MKLQKETQKENASPHGRWYEDACGTAFAMELIGERWSLLIIRELMLGGRRFSDLRASLPGISAKVLTERLDSLEKAGVLLRRKMPPPAAVQLYELTEWGYFAERPILELGRWAARSPDHDPTLPLSAVSLMLSFRTMFDAVRAGNASMRVGFDIAGETFLVSVTEGTLRSERADPGGADLVFRVPAAPVVAGFIYAGIPLRQLEADAGLRIEGDSDMAKRFATFFPLPPKVAPVPV